MYEPDNMKKNSAIIDVLYNAPYQLKIIVS